MCFGSVTPIEAGCIGDVPAVGRFADVEIKRGVQGIVASNYDGLLTPGMAPPMEMLPSIADAVGGRVFYPN